MTKIHPLLRFSAPLVLPCMLAASGLQPVFVAGEDPKPPNQTWVAVENMSDNFDGTSLDRSKWQDKPVGNGWTWDGRAPGLFKASNVTVKDGNLRVTVGKLDEPVVRGRKKFTHQGAIVRSLHPGQVGWYFECRMKANATAMSSTFWMMTKGNSKKKLELDIQECVGRVTDQTEEWAKTWDHIFHSNTIHRRNRFNPKSIQRQDSIPTETKNSDRYYVYGAWWKSSEEIRFYLDGKYSYSIRPEVAWDVPAYLQMAIETYSWNPIPEDGGLVESGTWEQRTTHYDWVRTWKLDSSPSKVSIPAIVGEYVNVYQPKGDVFPGPNAANLIAGQFYEDWVPNDHTFVRDESGRWHAFGITHPLTGLSDVHAGEDLLFHAIAPPGPLKDGLKEGSWNDQAKVLPPSERPGETPAIHAPWILKRNDVYHMVYGPIPIRHAVSKDLIHWTPKSSLKGAPSGRDPQVFVWNDTYHLIVCGVHDVRIATSRDFETWTERGPLLTMKPGFDPESPSVVRYNDTFYLFVCGWNGEWDRKEIQGAYQHKTYVYQSDNPLKFDLENEVAVIDAHAPEIFQDEAGDWFISSVEWPHRGVSIAPLVWE